ncbi:MAG: hypothetical protein OXG16_09005 [Rhodospirillales bacterium]|nr:hypothetical protein [Rhodospirillales bacterium]
MRDFTPTSDVIKPLNIKIKGLSATGSADVKLPNKLDLSDKCSPIQNQGGIGSCTAHAAAGIIEYYMNVQAGNRNAAPRSRLFIYRATRDLVGVTGDTGAWLRHTMGAMVLCGAPPEKHWPYTDSVPDFDTEPPSFVYAVADNFEATQYFCHDAFSGRRTSAEVLTSVKTYLAAGIPSVFGFYGFASADDGEPPGAIPYPAPHESAIWGHAVVAIGYDDDINVTNKAAPKISTTGALVLRNSWGTEWGQKGYGWLPYGYLHNGLALDFWSLQSMELVDTARFGS